MATYLPRDQQPDGTRERRIFADVHPTWDHLKFAVRFGHVGLHAQEYAQVYFCTLRNPDFSCFKYTHR